MTGYGAANGQLDGVVYAVEIKTVNNRYFKSRIKLPDLAAFLEEDIEKCEWVPFNKLNPYLDNAHASIVDVLKEGIDALHKVNTI